jgi:hypothetical protein
MATPAHYYTITPPSYINLGSGKPYMVSPSSSQHALGQTSEQRDGIESRGRADAFTTISGPEDCWSPSGKQRTRRTTSQAQALAQVLEQSPPPGGGDVTEMRVSDDAVAASRTRTLSVEEAEEALDMESRNGQSPSLVRVQEQGSISDSSSSEPCSRRESLDNVLELRFVKSKSLSAPPTPRGGRHPPPLDPLEFDDITLLSTSPCLSDPVFYFTQEFDQVPVKNNAPKKTKTGSRKSNRKKKGHSRRRSTK